MAIKNKRTSIVKESSIETRLKKQLKEDFDSMMEDEFDEEPTDDAGLGDDEFSDDSDAGLGDDSMGGDELGGDDDMAGLDDDTLDELNPTQEEWVDDQVDVLLDKNVDQTGDLGLEEDAPIMEADDDLDFEDDTDDFSGSTDDFSSEEGGEDPHAYLHDKVSTLSADQLNTIIDSPDSLGALEGDLDDQVLGMDDSEIESDIASFEDGGIDGEEDYSAGGDDFATDEDDFSDDDFLGESEELTEDAGDHKEPMTGITKLGFDKGYEGKDVKDELAEAAEPDGFKEENTKLQGKFTKAPDGKPAAKKIETEPKFTKVGKGEGSGGATGLKNESIKKSKMLVKAAQVIHQLQEAQKALMVENSKLKKVNGIFSAIGEQLSKETRKQIAESFEKCKTQDSVNKLYEKVVKIIKQKNKPTLNEAVKGTQKSTVKAAINENKSSGGDKVKQTLTEAQKRINFLMNVPGSEDYYGQGY